MTETLHTIPRILLSGLSGGSGKTFISLGLSRAWSKQNHQVVPFKKGPDYIDSAWLKIATSHPCYCLDPFFLEAKQLKEHFIHCFTHAHLSNAHLSNAHLSNDSITSKSKIAIIEGNRGLFDGKDVEGTCSSARLAHLLKCPVIVSINCTKMTRTVAALVMGINQFDPNLLLAGVILNNVGSDRHANIVQKSVELYTDIPVLGVLPRMKNNPIPERYMGLHLHEKDSQNELLDTIASFLSEHVDTKKIYQIAHETSPLTSESQTYIFDSKETDAINKEEIHEKDTKSLSEKQQTNSIIKTFSPAEQSNASKNTVNIAYIYDDALWFYYQENLDALKNAGANLIALSILDERPFQEQAHNIPFDALYIGGGFPELYAEKIAKSQHLIHIKELVENQMPIYAECGGFIILSKQLHIKQDGVNNSYAMANIFPTDTEFFKKPQGLGYITAHTQKENPYHPRNSIWNGHEFHFSKSIMSLDSTQYVLSLNPGHGMHKACEMGANKLGTNEIGVDGLVYKQCFAAYAHLFAPAVPHWAKNFISAAIAYKNNKKHIAT